MWGREGKDWWWWWWWGSKYPHPGASFSAEPGRHPCSLESIKGRGPGLSAPGATAAALPSPNEPGAAHLTLPQRKSTPTLTFNELPDYIRQ